MKFSSKTFKVLEEWEQQIATTDDLIEKGRLEAKVSAVTHTFRPELEHSAAEMRRRVKATDEKHKTSRAAKERARKLAEASWAKDPDTTIAATARGVKEALKDENHHNTEGTVRNWIKDLAPGPPRLGGRPRKN